MSGEDEGEENDQKDDFSSSKEFDFYFPFTKPLVLDLPTEEDRVTASAWVQKLETEPDTEEEKKQRLNYLKLLLFVLQRGRLSGIFKKQPPSGPLQPFPQGFTIFDMGNWILDQDDAQTCGGGDAGRVPYTVEISNDLREFVASQEIPNFGVQMYYAWSSDEPIHKWSSFDEEKFPQYILDKIKQIQDTRSEEKSSMRKSSCSAKKKGCNLSLSDKYSKRKVKSPQEIERSQGRSFHTYMGLVGRMGNFNDKCDDDPEKFQRQDQKKGKCPRRSGQKKCPGSGGEAEDMPGEEEFDNLVSGLGGLNSLNRPCFCHHTEYSDQYSKGGPQPYENQQTPNRSCGFNMRSEPENSQWTATVSQQGPRRMRDQCLEGEMSQVISPQRRSPSPRPRSSSPNRPNIDCPTEDESGGFSNRGGICICSSPCTCPCPRGTPKMSDHKTSSAGIGGRTFPDASRTFLKSSKQDPCGFEEDRGMGSCHPSFNSTDPCTPMQTRPDMSPVGGRTGVTSGLRPLQGPEVIHCYDNKNPDPSLTKNLEKSGNWVPTMGGGNRYMNTDLKLACGRDQLISAAQQNKCKMSSRRELFSSMQSSPPVHGTTCQQSSGMVRISTPLESHPLCDYSPSEEAGMQCPVLPNQGAYSNYLDCEGSTPPPQMRGGFHENCGRQKADTYKKTGPQSINRFKNTSSYTGGPGPYVASNNTGRLANMTNVLQGIKQKAEAHREKCSQMRSPMRSEAGSYHSPQSPDVSSPSSLERGYLGIPLPHDQCPKPNSPYPGYYPSRQLNYQDDCEAEFEEEDECECESSESQETCPQETISKRLPRSEMQSGPCGPQNISSREDEEYYSKTITSEDYGVSFSDDHYCDQQYIDAENSPSNIDKTLEQGCYPMNFMESESQSCGSRRTGPGNSQDTRMSISPKDCGPQRMPPGRGLRDCGPTLRPNSNRRGSQRMSPRRTSPSECMSQEPSECYSSYQESDRQTCDTSVLSPNLAGNRYFNESFKLRSSTPYKPVTSTPLLHYKRNFQDQKNDDLSTVRPSSNRCV